MTVIPAHRLSRCDMRLIGNNVEPQVLAEQREARPGFTEPVKPTPMFRAAADVLLDPAAINRSLAVHGEAIPLAG